MVTVPAGQRLGKRKRMAQKAGAVPARWSKTTAHLRLASLAKAKCHPADLRRLRPPSATGGPHRQRRDATMKSCREFPWRRPITKETLRQDWL